MLGSVFFPMMIRFLYPTVFEGVKTWNR